MSNFSEILEELIFESNHNFKTFAAEIGIGSSSITDYVRNGEFPTVINLLKIADYFQRSTDYLLGREAENDKLTFRPCPPFCERLKFLKEHFGCNAKTFYEEKGVTKSRYYDWLSGKRQPSVDNLIRLANKFDCRVDFILGRES